MIASHFTTPLWKEPEWECVRIAGYDFQEAYTTQLFLASNSPRRRELLALGGYEFETLSTQVER